MESESKMELESEPTVLAGVVAGVDKILPSVVADRVLLMDDNIGRTTFHLPEDIDM